MESTLNICEDDKNHLLLTFIKERNYDKILFYSRMIDFNKYPDTLIHLGEYFQSINDNDMAEYSYKRALNYPTIQKDALVGLAAFYICQKKMDKYAELESNYEFDEKVCYKLACNILMSNRDLTIELLKRFPSKESYKLLAPMMFTDTGKYVQTNLFFAKRYGIIEAENTIRTSISLAIDDSLKEKQIKSKLSKGLQEMIDDWKLIGHYIILFGTQINKCRCCKEKHLQYYLTSYHNQFLQLECKHYLCQKCCYDNFDENTCQVVCPCGYKSPLLYNCIVNEIQKTRDSLFKKKIKN